MSVRLARIVRHPIKSIGWETADAADLGPGRPLPFDRKWAVAHKAARIGDGEGGWAPKVNFLRGVSASSLMAVRAQLADDGRTLTLDHPDRSRLTVRPGSADDAALIDWLSPLWPATSQRPSHVVTAEAAMTDVPDPWLSIGNLASHQAVAERLGMPDLSIHRWRANLWIEGLAPWAEFDWIGRELRIGGAILHVRERITRCKATMGNPETGRRDADTLVALDGFGHQDFGVYAEVTRGARVDVGDELVVI